MKHLNLLYKFYRFLVCKRQHIHYETLPSADFSVETFNCNNGTIHFGRNVYLRSNVSVRNLQRHSIIEFGDNTDIGRGTTLSCYNKIIMHNNVLTGPYVFISDHNHKYTDISKPVMYQGIEFEKNSRVEICDGVWIGTNAVIVGNVRIGRNSVIAANSVVNKDVPDFCVVAGAPAKIIKRYDMNTCQWIKIK
mgnify:CR=1 FL=1